LLPALWRILACPNLQSWRRMFVWNVGRLSQNYRACPRNRTVHNQYCQNIRSYWNWCTCL
jgi:hypothetical protein